VLRWEKKKAPSKKKVLLPHTVCVCVCVCERERERESESESERERDDVCVYYLSSVIVLLYIQRAHAAISVVPKLPVYGALS
jgi:hypothetical protein